MRIKVLLNSGSTINEGRFAKGGDKLSPEYQKECAVAVIHPRIFKELVSHHRIKEPQIKENGTFRKAQWDEALDRTAEILVNAKRPLLFMGSETSCEAMEVGLHIAEYLGAVVDSNATECHGPTAMGIQEAGRVGSTAGQPKLRSSLAIYWGANPFESMPRHMSRYSIFPRGYWTKRGRFDRTIVTVD